jgi:hypothetical protein
VYSLDKTPGGFAVTDQDIVDKLSVTRAKIEAVTAGPVVIAITSARLTDGADLLGSSLAKSLSGVGRDVLLLCSRATPVAPEPRRIGIREGNDSGPSVIALAGSYSFDAAQAAYEEYRSRFAFTVVCAGPAAKNGSALSLACAADFVLIAVEQGRSSREDDRELARVLNAANAKTFGVVTIDRKTIRDFGRKASEMSFSVFPSRVDLDDTVARSASFAAKTG